MHLYLHVPFCVRRCSYCDFAIAVRKQVPSQAYADAILQEWRDWQTHPIWQTDQEIETIYFGGGTPSLLEPSQLRRVLDPIRDHRPVVAGAELTIEANPDDISDQRVREWRSMGINRISLGAQSFDPTVLEWMHRTHRADAIARAVRLLREAGVGNISLDLIFALPPHLNRDWTRDLDLALSLEPDHLSLYGLTVEDRTPLSRWLARGEMRRAEDAVYAREFLQAHQALGAGGYQHYEVSNAAKPGFRSRHNSAYWRRGSFIGLGPSAHSGWGAQRRWNIREWSAYQLALTQGQPVMEGEEQLDAEAVALEDLYLGLRTVEGVSEDLVPVTRAEAWIQEGWAGREGGRLALTAEGWLRLDALVSTVEMEGSSPRP